ncbi:hypothetical protein FGO68_gene10749 [Halteria grandinella]|uniref:non-specific serine/threonine protein kinase n=1 Tax=Halteria grandinella TaxID=5974 RepID=A0A8J8T568_HALGN|nr:hypothetical protein FGO68_gene10749 [Halteria grandinella]
MSDVLNDYRIIRKLGVGSFADTFLAESIRSNGLYFIKILKKERAFPQENSSKDITEMKFLKAAEHPFVIQYIEDFPYPIRYLEQHCIVLEYADGQDLRKKLASLKNQVTEDVLLTWVTLICLALAYVHAKGLLHRNINPDNILIVGEQQIAKLGGFGTISNIYSSDKTVGTWQYSAPERFTQDYQDEADIWSLGVVLNESHIKIL